MNRLIIVFIVSIFMLLSCDGKVTITLYTEDIIGLNTDEPVYTDAVVGFSAPSDDQKTFVNNLLAKYFKDATNFREESINYSSYIFADVKIPLLRKSETMEINDLFYIVVKQGSSGSNFGLGMNKEKYEALQAEVSEEFYQTIDIDDWVFRIKLNNDSKRDFNLTTECCYINDVAYPFSNTMKIKNRDTVDMLIPSVLRDYIWSQRETIFAKIWSSGK